MTRVRASVSLAMLVLASCRSVFEIEGATNNAVADSGVIDASPVPDGASADAERVDSDQPPSDASTPPPDSETMDALDVSVPPIVSAMAERCNGEDDNGNGVVDEGFSVAQECRSLGACGAGTFECDAEGGQRCSTSPGSSDDRSSLELCDDALIDEDCDGSVNEDCPCKADLACGSRGEGVCEYGIQRCDPTSNRYLPCEGAIEPAAREECDGVDGDCDGLADAVDPDLAGTFAPEICNGKDDDCDGDIDDGYTVGAPCLLPGACGAGVFECDAVSKGQRCSSGAGGSADRSGPEECNGSDDDCDGQSDVDDSDLDTARGPERCNQRDDDCDGLIDEDFDVGRRCAAPGVCGAGSFECDANGAQRCSSEARAVPEACDPARLDENCDGQRNEGCDCAQRPQPLEEKGDFHGGARCATSAPPCSAMDGQLAMSVCHECSAGSWSTCRAAAAQNWHGFDANGGGSGTLEISFCADDVLNAKVEFWYGTHPRRKGLVLYSPGQPRGCRTLYFSPQDACFGDFPELSAPCHNLCGRIDVSGCVFDYASVETLLTVSRCTGATSGRFRLVSVTMLNDDCRCVESSSCTTGDRTQCRVAVNKPDLKFCATVDCPGRGNACLSVVNGVECQSRIECNGNKPVCPTMECY